MMRDTKILSKNQNKHLYDIIVNHIIGRVLKNGKIKKKETNHNLASAIRSLHFLIKADLPLDVFDPEDFLKKRWLEMVKVDKYDKLDLSKKSGLTIQHQSYYAMRETMQSTIDAMDHFAEDGKLLNEVQLWMSFSSWKKFFFSKNHLLQFEMKNLICKSIYAIFFKYDNKGKFIQEFEDCKIMITALVCDIILLMETIASNGGRSTTSLEHLIEQPNFFNTDETWIELRNLYGEAKKVNISNKMV